MRLRLLYILCMFLLLASPAMAADTYMGFATGQNSNNLIVFDPNTQGILTTLSPGTGTYGVAVNPGGTLLYVCNDWSSTVSVYNVNDYTLKYTITTPGGANAITLNSIGTRGYVGSWTGNCVYVVDLTTNTITNTISVGTNPISLSIKGDYLYVVNYGSDTVSVINTNTNTVAATINVGDMPLDLVVLKNTGKAYVACSNNKSIDIINTNTNTKTGWITTTGGPTNLEIKNNDADIYVGMPDADMVYISTTTDTITTTVSLRVGALGITNDDTTLYASNITSYNIHAIDVATGSLKATLSNTSLNHTPQIIIAKVAAESTSTAPMQVTFTITSGVLRVTNANVSVYDATTGTLINSDNTDDAGNTIFWIIPGKRYTVTVTGDDVTTASQSVQVQPNKDQYTINVETNGWNWNPFDWFSTNGTSTSGNADQTKSITSGFTTKLVGTTGYIDVLYNDTTGGTSSVNFSLYYRNTSSGEYEYVSSKVVASNNASNNFTILNAAGNSYKFYANGTNLLFSNDPIPRVGEYAFPSAPFNLGWPESWYMYFEIMVFLIIGYMSTRRKAVMLAGSAFMLFVSWVFLLIGWLNQFSLMVPIMISVFAILIFAYAIAKWRMESGI